MGKSLLCLRHESAEMVSQLWFIGCKEFNCEGGIDCRALVNRHDFERLLQPGKGIVFL